MEQLQIGHLFADTAELDGLAHHSLDAEGRAAAGIAVQLGEDHAVNAQILVEGLGHVDGILTGHGVHGEEDFLGLDFRLDAAKLLHEGIVDVKAAGGIDDEHVAAIVVGVLDGLFGGFDRILRAVLVHGDVDLLAHHFQLLDGGGAVNIAGGQHGLLALLAQVIGQLTAHGGFTGALQTAQHINSRNGR